MTNKCEVSNAWRPDSGTPEPSREQFDALWDTGATGSMILQSVVDRFGLKPTGVTNINQVKGSFLTTTYLVNVVLPNGVGYPNVRVSLGSFTGADVLIGMDIITSGDFVVSNFNGVTKFSFRHPSMSDLDFVQDLQRSRFSHGVQHKRKPKKRKN